MAREVKSVHTRYGIPLSLPAIHNMMKSTVPVVLLKRSHTNGLVA